jgi:hypothetical protein
MAFVVNTLNRGGGGGTEITVVANYSALPDPTTVSGEFYWAEASQGTSWLPGSLGGTYYNSGMYYSNGVAWQFMNVPYQATQAEVNTGTNTDKFVTPNTLKNSTQFQYINSLTSNAQTQIDAKLNKAKFISSGYVSLTGVTGQTVIASILIPANTYSSGQSFEIVTGISKSITASAMSFNIYHDTALNGISNVISNGLSFTTNNRCGSIVRQITIDGTTARNSITNTVNSTSPFSAFTSAPSTTAFNPAVDNYITITANPTVTTETFGVTFLSVRPL